MFFIGTCANRRAGGRSFSVLPRVRLVVSFVFAVIHPQGIVAVPEQADGRFAVGFTIHAAKFRGGSLISCMIAHGLNNALIMSLATFVFSI